MAEFNPDQLPLDLPLTTTEFEADGHTYFVHHNIDLTVERNRWLEKYSLFATLGRDAKSLIAEIHRAYQANNAQRAGDVAVILDNLMRGASDLLSRESPILYICTLFINRQDEDLKTYSPEFANVKIAQWKKAGIKMSFFLNWALDFLRLSDESLNALTQISLASRLPVLDGLQGEIAPDSSPLPNS